MSRYLAPLQFVRENAIALLIVGALVTMTVTLGNALLDVGSTYAY